MDMPRSPLADRLFPCELEQFGRGYGHCVAGAAVEACATQWQRIGWHAAAEDFTAADLRFASVEKTSDEA